jgi:rhodanese-related sulfurtransferase
MSDISAKELKQRIEDQNPPYLLDVRERIEFHTFNIGGQHIPLGNILDNVEELPENKDTEIVVLCAKGIRSRTAAKILAQLGYTNCRNLTGGLSSFQRI